MKAIIDKLAIGTVEYDIPSLKLSETAITIESHVNTSYEGEFIISSDSNAIKGVVYSSDERFVIINPQFSGKECVIKYKFIAKNCSPLEKITGHIDIISNGGEGEIAFVANILEDSLNTSIGEVKNYFTFTNLVQMNYDEAVRLFVSDRFREVLLADDLKSEALYDALMKNANKELALEEFLIAIGKKKPVTLSLSEYSQAYKNINTSCSGEFLIEKDGWGYVDVDVEIIGSFFHSCKTKIRKDDFNGNTFEYKYVISYNMLHPGINLGKLVFKTHNQRLEFDVKIELETEKPNEITAQSQIRRDLARITKLYLNFRMNRINVTKWADNVVTVVDDILEIEPGNQMAKICKAQAYLSLNKWDEAADLLNEISAIVIPDRDKNITQYCYYLYVRALFKKSAKFTRDIDAEIKSYYENGHDDWQILWILMYLNERYKQNPSLKYTMIKDHCKNGANSTILYYDALLVLNEQPGLLRVLDEFEIRILMFGSRWKFINEKLARRVAELALEEKEYNKLICRMLMNVYEENPIPEVAHAICCALINGRLDDKSYNKWFEIGIENNARITKLFEYYMFSLEDKKYKQLPLSVYRYFHFNADSIPNQKSYFFANIIENRKAFPEIYEDYKDIILKYGLEMLKEGRTNKHLAIIYDHILTKEYIDKENATKLAGIINSYEIYTENENINEVIVVHKEKKTEVRNYISNGCANVELYTEEPIILFADVNGNRFVQSVDYKLTKLNKLDDYLDSCFELSQEDEKLKLHYAEKYIKYRNNPLPDVEIFKNILEINSLRDGYRRLIMGDIIDYYYDNFDGSFLDEYLTSLDVSNMYDDTRIKTIEMMITRGLYKEAYPLLSVFGYRKIAIKLLIAFADKMIEEVNYELDDLILKISEYIFIKGNTDEIIVKYLYKYYYGTIPEMMKLFKIGIELAGDSEEYRNELSSDIMERLLVQMMFESFKGNELYEVFKYYYPSGIARKLKNAFFTYCAHNYFVRRNIINTEVFSYIELELSAGARMPIICKIALLKYLSTLSNITNKQKEYARKLISDLTEKNVAFEFYKKFIKYFTVPYQVLDKTYIEHHTNPKYKVSISYTITKQDKTTGLLSAEMTQNFPGVFVKAFPLFANDRIDYYFNERFNDSEVTIEGKSITVSPIKSGLKNGKSRYELINDLVLNEDNDISRDIYEFYNKRKIAQNLFEVL